MPSSRLQRFINRLTMRSVLTREEQQAVLGLPCEATQVQANRDFVPLGERTQHSCLVASGIVGRFDQNGEGKRQITAMHVPGDMCDLHSVVQPVATSALQSLSVATIVRIPHAALRAIAARYPALGEAFWRDCIVDAAILSQWVVNIGQREARVRIAHLLCEMATRLGATGNGDEVWFDFPMTQTQMGEATALTAVHVNRSLQSLRAAGLVEWQQRAVHLPSWKSIVDVAEFDPAYLQCNIRPEQRLRIVPN